MKVPAAIVIACVAFSAFAGSADAIRDQRIYPVNLEGSSCTATSTASVRLPRAARLISVESPSVGDLVGGQKAGQFPKSALARVTGMEIRRGRVTITATADPTQCGAVALPGEPTDAPWAAAADLEVSYLTPSVAWARSLTRNSIRNNAAPAFADPGYYRIACKRRGVARFRCRFSAFAGDSVVYGSGTVSLAQDAEFPRVRFRATFLDEYCVAVLRRPVRRCVRRATWR